MRIAFDSQIFLLQKYGGISRYFYELAKELSNNNGVKQFIVAPFYINRYIQKNESINIIGCRSFFSFNLILSNRYLRKINLIYFYLIYFFKLLIAHFFLISINPKIIHETYYSRFRIGRKKAIRILTVYDMIHEKFPEFFGIINGTTKLKKIAVERADHIICISESTRQDLMEILQVPESKITVVYLGYNPRTIDDDECSQFQHKYTKAIGDKPYIFFVGSRCGYKNFNRLVEALWASSIIQGGHKLVCFGGGSFSVDELHMFKNYGFADESVIQLDGDDTQLNNLYANASIFVYPSIYEGFGMPPLEAMANGCPVACSKTSSLPEVVGDAAIFFDPLDVNSISKSVKEIITSEIIRKKLIENGRKQIVKFSWERCAIETQRVYEKAALIKGLT